MAVKLARRRVAHTLWILETRPRSRSTSILVSTALLKLTLAWRRTSAAAHQVLSAGAGAAARRRKRSGG